MTQYEFDETPGITVHLLADDSHPPRALCSGLEIDPDRWRDDTKTVRKQCQACRLAAARAGRTTEYVLVKDDDGHWYVCPADKRHDALDALDKVADYWRLTTDADGTEEPAVPDYLVPVGGAPGRVVFAHYRIER